MKKFLRPLPLVVSIAAQWVVFGSLLTPSVHGTDYPAWWVERDLILRNPTDPTVPAGADDYSPVNQGQVKNVATKAFDELEARLAAVDGGIGDMTAPNGTGYVLTEMIKRFETIRELPANEKNTDDFQTINLGQLKAVAKPFYDRLIEVGWLQQYPWTASPNSADDYSLANLGQLKNLFSFDLSDPDHDGLPTVWEIAHGFDPNSAVDGESDDDGDDLPVWQEYMIGTNPSAWDTDGDLISDIWEVEHALNPLVATDGAQDPDGDGLPNVGEYTWNTNPQNRDTDEDGISDGWEASRSLDPNDDGDALQDPDGDLLTNLQEYQINTDPWPKYTVLELSGGPDLMALSKSAAPAKLLTKLFDGGLVVTDVPTLTEEEPIYAEGFEPKAINTFGEIAGDYRPEVSSQEYRAGVWRNGGFTEVPIPESAWTNVPTSWSSYATGISDAGELIGTATDGVQHVAFRWNLHTGIFGVLAGSDRNAQPVAINADGDIAGHVQSAENPNVTVGFVTRGDRTIEIKLRAKIRIQALSDSGIVAGITWDQETPGNHPVNPSVFKVKRNGSQQFVVVNDREKTVAAINSSGQILGAGDFAVQPSGSDPAEVFLTRGRQLITNWLQDPLNYAGRQFLNPTGYSESEVILCKLTTATGSDPAAPCLIRRVILPFDQDGDGMNDEWENHFGLDPNNAADAGYRWRGNGQTALQYFQGGYVPGNGTVQSGDWTTGIKIILTQRDAEGGGLDFFWDPIANPVGDTFLYKQLQDGSWVPAVNLPIDLTTGFLHVP